MAAPPQTVGVSEFLPLFSGSVGNVAARLGDGSAVTVWRIVSQLLTDHENYGGAELLPLEREGRERPLHEWLALVGSLYDRPAVARSTSEVIDGRLLLLGLARIDDDLGELLRSTGFRWRLERDLGFPLTAVLVPWALPAPRTRLVELWRRDHPDGLACAFSPDGLALATAGDDGWLRIWDVASGALVHEIMAADELSTCRFSADGRFVVAGHDDGTLRAWEREGMTETAGSPGFLPETMSYALAPDSPLLATTTVRGAVLLHDVALGPDAAVLGEHGAAARDCAFSPDGSVLASVGDDGACFLWDVASRTQRAVLPGSTPMHRCLFSPDGRLLATIDERGMIVLWHMPRGDRLGEVQTNPRLGTPVAFSADGRLLAASDGEDVRSWDVAPMPDGPPQILERPRGGYAGGAPILAFSPDGRLLATQDDVGVTRLVDVASGAERVQLEQVSPGPASTLAFSPEGGVLATITNGGDVKLWEEVAPPGLLPAVVSDATAGPDVIGVATDAAALANLIAAAGTTPPLSIGLFGDWGSGKTFLIKQVQEKVRRLARRSQQVPGSAYCAHVRNIEFNAWHYADANLWASLVTHIFDELAKPEQAAGADHERRAREQLARLEEELAAQSELRGRLERAQVHAERTKARKQLLALTSGLAGLEGEASLVTARERITGGLSWLKLVVPTRKVGVGLTGAATVLGGGLAAALWAIGVDEVYQGVSGFAAFLAGAAGTARIAARSVTRLIAKVGETAKVAEVRSDTIDAELEAARARELELREELADLASGRRLARFAAERRESHDYRAHLGLVWRIHRDFQRMSEILEAQARQEPARPAETGQAPPAPPVAPERGRLGRAWSRLREILPGSRPSAPEAAPAVEEPAPSGLPRIDRIVLYIDDLDRCPPKRVVEVLEAVHLILALKLFVVVLAVDPRWLLQSLELHYSELLADGPERPPAARPEPADDDGGGPAKDEDEEAWLSTPLNYLEKIIQIPFALRPMGPTGGGALVNSLLPVAPSDDAGRDADRERPGGVPGGAAPAQPRRPPRERRPVRAPASRPSRAVPSLSPRALALTPAERDFAASLAPVLRTPRAVKKFTNLYRLLRAGLDEAGGELDRFLHDDGENVPEFHATLILLAVVIAFPEDASRFLLDIGDLAPDAPADDRSWAGYARDDRHPVGLRTFVGEATDLTANGTTSTREPFRRWALEVSRYSFATGQEVFARYHARAGL